MGTTAEKFNYVFETKDLLKTEINKINNVLDDNSTFRSYPQELFNGYLDILNNGTDTLWSNLEKVSASGEEATLENVETAPIKMVLNGNTSQDTTSGKNKFSTDYLDSYTYDTYTQLSKNSFEFNATTSWRTSRFKIPCKSNTDYYFNLKQDLSVSTRNVYIVIRGVQTGKIIYELYVGYLKAFNSGENTELMINIQSGGAALSGKIYNIQLEEGTSPTEFEEYTGGIPSPNPDYPQEVKVVTGENVVSVSGENQNSKTDYPIDLVAENIFDKDDARILRSYIDVNDKKNKTSNNDYSVIVKVKPSTKYIVTKMANNPESQARFRLGTTTNYPQMGGAKDTVCNQVISNDTATELSITTESNDNYLVIFCYNLNSTTTLNEMLGSLVVREAEPTYAEMCKIGNRKDYLFKRNGKWYVHKEIGKILVDENSSVGVYSAPRFRVYVANFVSPSATEKADILCDKLRTVTKNALASVDNVISGSDSGRTGEMLVRINAEINTLELLKQFLEENNLTLYYVLATPTETEITNTTLIEQLEAISKAKSVKDKTYITQTNDELPFILDVEAIKEYSAE